MLFCCLLQHHLKWLGYRFTGRRYTTFTMASFYLLGAFSKNSKPCHILMKSYSLEHLHNFDMHLERIYNQVVLKAYRMEVAM